MLLLILCTCIPRWSRDELDMEGIKLGKKLGLVNNIHVGVDQDPAHALAPHHMTKVGPGLMIGMGMQAAVTRNY